MHKKILLLLLAFLSFNSLSQTIQLNDDERRKVRQTNLEIAKQTCISFFDTNQKRQLLFNLSISLDDQCRCTQDAVGYLVSDDLAAYVTHAMYEVRTNGFEKIDAKLKSKLDEHNKIVMTAMQGCNNKLKR